MRRKFVTLVGLWAATSWLLVACSDDDNGQGKCGNHVCDVGETAESCPEDCGCGNGFINTGEDCDGADLGGKTCQALGYGGGILGCTADCKYDTSQCTGGNLCGNGILDSGEDCDGQNLNGQSCTSLGFDGGTLSCDDTCHFDTSQCTGGNLCGNGVIDAGEDCDGTDLGGETCATQGFDGGELACSSCAFDTSGCCQNDCDTDGATKCNGDVIQTCTQNSAGCLTWQDAQDCSADGMICSEDSGDATCQAPCQDNCPSDGDLRCNGNLVEVCTTTQEGCLDWTTQEDCGANSGICADLGNGPECMVSGDGSCEGGAIVIDQLPYDATGTDITQDASENFDWSNNQGCETDYGADGPEMVYAISMTAGETILVEEPAGGMDSVLRVLPTCDASAQCLASVDDAMGGAEQLLFTAPSDGVFYIVVESYSGSPYDPAYGIHVEEVPPESSCDDGNDNDYDGLTDCEDPDCFGKTGCTTESICDDGQDNDGDGDTDCADSDCSNATICEATEQTCDDGFDNDGDGATDCDDSDCASLPVCQPLKAVYQQFDDTDPFDLSHWQLTFTPDSNDPNGYTWTKAPIADLPIVPGSGDASQVLDLGDDDATEIPIDSTNGMGSFTFYGVTYQSFFVVSNGRISFAEESSWYSDTTDDDFLLAAPKIAVVDDDLSPNLGGTVIVDQFSDKVVVTFQDVPRYYYNSETATFQVILHSDGTIDLAFGDVTIASSRGIYTGITAAVGTQPYPDETDFNTPPPVINEVMYDNDGSDTAEFVELYGTPNMDLTGYYLIAYNGANGDAYRTIDLSGYSIPADGFFVIGSSQVPEADVHWTDLGLSDTNVLQNGPDSLVLYLTWDDTNKVGVPMDAVEWETGAANSYAEGSPARGVIYGSWDTSIGRHPDGSDTDDNSTDFVVAWWPTPGAPNTPGEPYDETNPYSRVTGTTQSDQAGHFPLDIPDNDANGLTVTFDLNDSQFSWFDFTSLNDLQVGLRIAHPDIGELTVTLTAPDGSTTVTLHNKTDAGTSNIDGVYDMTLTPDVGQMSDLLTVTPVKGVWTLNIVDDTAGNQGQLLQWVMWFQGP